jgi:hypothetical protein
MPETDILNPVQGFDPDLGDSMNPSFGFTRKRANTRSNKKPTGGQPYSRELSNAGHVYTLSWLGRTLAVAQRLKWYAEQYEDGFFTIIDWDSNERQYVGKFTSDVNPVLTANNKWDMQMVEFTEIPICPMVQYPTDWVHEAIWHYPFNDYGDQKLAVSGAWAKATHVFGTKTVTTMDTAGANAGDWAQFEYRGYGFQLSMLKGPAFGKTDIYVDGALLQTVDCYAAVNQGPQIVLSKAGISLDFHRVKAVVDATQNAGATAPALSWAGLQVMR